MKILLFAEQSLHTYRLIRYALAPHKYQIVLLHQAPWSQEETNTYIEGGASSEIVFPDPERWKRPKTKLGRKLVLFRESIKTAKKVNPDVISIQFVGKIPAAAAPLLAGTSRRLILSFWGSDLLRQHDRLFLRGVFPIILNRADAITFDGLSMLERLNSLYGKKYDSKVHVVRFPNPIIDLIKQLQQRYSQKELRSRLGLPHDGRIIIVAGYSNIPEHNHLKITQAIAALPQETQKKLFLIYPMTYGMGTQQYLEQIDAARNKLLCESTILRKFLTDEECACLYLSSNAFIHAQTTDAFSQTFVDYIYAGATIFQAKWLHYPEIDRYNINLYEFSDYSQLTQLLADYLNNYPNRCIQQTPETLNVLYQTEAPEEIAKQMKKIVEPK